MLHRVNPPHCLDELKAILRFQREVLEFACTLTDPSALDETIVKAKFSAAGEWLCARLWKRTGEPQEFHAALIRMIKHVKGHAATRQRILSAFDNDTAFDHDLEDRNFRFSYRNLDETTKAAVRPLMVAFYNDLLKTGYPSVVHGGAVKVDRDALVDAFWKANPEMYVCPACDDPRPTVIDDKVYADEDHFFPKSSYPFLSMHAANLLPVCTTCNTRIKLSADPIDDHNDEPLLNSFHPYGAPAVENVDVLISRSATGERQINISDHRGMPSRRVARLNDLLKLEKRWYERLERSVGMIIDELRGQPRLLQRLKETSGDEDLRVSLEYALSVKRDKIGKTHWYILQSSYLQYVLEDSDEFDLLLTEFTEA